MIKADGALCFLVHQYKVSCDLAAMKGMQDQGPIPFPVLHRLFSMFPQVRRISSERHVTKCSIQRLCYCTVNGGYHCRQWLPQKWSQTQCFSRRSKRDSLQKKPKKISAVSSEDPRRAAAPSGKGKTADLLQRYTLESHILTPLTPG